MEKEFLVCIRALAKIIQHIQFSNVKADKLKTPQGIFELFVSCLLNQNVTPEHYFQVINSLRKDGWLKYEKLLTADSTDLIEALSSYRFPNKATKAIITNVGKIDREYEGNLHNIYLFSQKDTLEVWKRTNQFYWFGVKKSAVFIRELVSQGVWDLSLEDIPIPPDRRVRRVLWKLGFVKDRNDLKEIQQVARELSSRSGITPLDLDCVLWSIGDICRERRTFCEKCPLDFYCPTFLKGGSPTI